MSFLKKVKYNYYQNNLNDLKKTNDLKEIIAFLKNLANSKPKIYEELIEKNIDDLFQYKGLDEFFPKNLIWINSFLSKDADLIKHFLEFYLQNAENFTINNYFETALEHYDHSMDFNQFVEKGYNLQNIISKKSINSILFNTCAFFLIKKNNILFTHPYLTKCFIYIVRNPYDIYHDLKLLNADKERSMNQLFNLDSQLDKFKKPPDTFLEYPKQSWQINLKSWADQKVLDDYNGLILKYDELINNPFDFFSTIILHFKDKGVNIEVKYDLIQEFVDRNQSLFEGENKIDISNKEIKQIKNIISETLEDLELLYEPN